MNIILVGNYKGTPRNYNLGRMSIFTAIVMAVSILLSASVGYAGYLLGTAEQIRVVHATAPTDEMARLDEMMEQLARERDRLEATKGWAEAEMDALGARLGRMQAHVLRLNAFGERMAHAASLDSDEFNFQSEPAQGGPVEPEVFQRPGGLELDRSLYELTRQLDDRERQLEFMAMLLVDRSVQSDLSPAGKPVKNGWISSRFGMRTDPVNGKRSMHRGIDIAGKRKSAVVAVAAGVVVFSGRRSKYGNMVEIDHGRGFATRYAHNHANKVDVGDVVSSGQVIALLGSSGRATGPHVHFEVLRDGERINPLKFIRRAGRD